VVIHESNPADPAVTPTVRKNTNSKMGIKPAFLSKN
jgi:hypothetical protein